MQSHYPCPVCLGIRMKKKTPAPDKSLVLDVCPLCGGIWFDRGEVLELRQAAVETVKRSIDLSRKTHKMRCHYCFTSMSRNEPRCCFCNWKNTIDCPVCGQPMKRTRCRNLILDVCGKCGGVWFDRHELAGVPLTQIAQDDGFDIRTVKKQIEIERMERERREARALVLREALQQHYVDLCDFTQKLNAELAKEAANFSDLRGDPMWKALKQHLPRWTMWQKLDRWEHLQLRINEVYNQVHERFRRELISRSGVPLADQPDGEGWSLLIDQAVKHHCQELTNARPGLTEKFQMKDIPYTNGLRHIQVGAYSIGIVPTSQVAQLKGIVTDLLNDIAKWEQQDEVRKIYTELNSIKETVREELTTIILRRVVPGRCTYCPI